MRVDEYHGWFDPFFRPSLIDTEEAPIGRGKRPRSLTDHLDDTTSENLSMRAVFDQRVGDNHRIEMLYQTQTRSDVSTGELVEDNCSVDREGPDRLSSQTTEVGSSTEDCS